MMKQKIFCFSLIICVLLFPFAMCEASDFNGDCVTDLADAIIPLSMMAGLETEPLRPDWEEAGFDINGDKKIGMEEVIHILRQVANNISAYEEDDTPEQATILVVNDSCFQQHDFHDSGDADWIKFHAKKGMPYSIEAANIGNLSDVRIQVYDTDGKTELAAADGKKSAFQNLYWGNSEDWTDREDGDYYVKLTNTNSDAFGKDTEYNIQIHCYEDNDSPEQANLISTETVAQHHNFHDAGDEDWVMFYAAQDGYYTIEAVNPGSRCDVNLELYEMDADTSIEQAYSGTLLWTCGKEGIYFVKTYNTDSVFGKDTEYDLRITLNTAPISLGRITGYVLDASSGSKIKIQELTITCSCSTPVYYNSTYGIYYVSGLEKGYYTLTANAPGYKTSVITVKVETSAVRKDIYMRR